jgi:4-hydroxy-tetrahydrodipicolinate reductase
VSAENAAGAALVAEKLSDIDVVIDFTTPTCVLRTYRGLYHCGKNMVVGTTGWHGDLDQLGNWWRATRYGVGLCGKLLGRRKLCFFDVARTAAAALRHEYSGQIFERHHAQKKDAPSGTAIAIQHVVREASGRKRRS